MSDFGGQDKGPSLGLVRKSPPSNPPRALGPQRSLSPPPSTQTDRAHHTPSLLTPHRDNRHSASMCLAVECLSIESPDIVSIRSPGFTFKWIACFQFQSHRPFGVVEIIQVKPFQRVCSACLCKTKLRSPPVLETTDRPFLTAVLTSVDHLTVCRQQRQRPATLSAQLQGTLEPLARVLFIRQPRTWKHLPQLSFWN